MLCITFVGYFFINFPGQFFNKQTWFFSKNNQNISIITTQQKQPKRETFQKTDLRKSVWISVFRLHHSTTVGTKEMIFRAPTNKFKQFFVPRQTDYTPVLRLVLKRWLFCAPMDRTYSIFWDQLIKYTTKARQASC